MDLMEDYVDNDDDPHSEPVLRGNAMKPRGGRAAKNRLPTETRPEFGLQIVEESSAKITKDVTVIHTDWKTGKKGQGVELFVPGVKRNAIAWQVAHTYFAYDGAEMFVCNICGKDLKLSGTAGAISSHLRRRHPGIKEKMEDIERAGGAQQIKHHAIVPAVPCSPQLKKRKRISDLPMVMNGNGNGNKKGLNSGPSTRTVSLPPPESSKAMAVVASNVSKALTIKPGSKAFERKLFAIQAQKEAQIMYLIGEGLNFTHVESKWHQQLIHTTVAAARMGASPSDLELTAGQVRASVFTTSRILRERLKERIRLGQDLTGSANHWVSRQGVSYVAFSVQWIEEKTFKLEAAVLAVYVLKTKLSDVKDDVFKDFDSKLQDWQINDAVKFVVTDRPVVVENAFGRAIEKMTNAEPILCLDYLLNLVAAKAFEGALGVDPGEEYGEFDSDDVLPADDTDTEYEEDDGTDDQKMTQSPKKGLLPKVRKLVGHFESSIQASEELMAIAKQLCASEEEREALNRLAQDVHATWWSTQNMLERLFGTREAITTYVGRKWMPGATAKENRPPRLTEENWDDLEQLHFMLRPLRFAQQMLQGQLSVTASFVPLVVHLIYKELESIHLEESNAPSVKAIAKEMLQTMNELFGNFCSQEHQRGGRLSLPPLGVAANSIKTEESGAEVRIHKSILLAHALDPRFKAMSVFPLDVQDQIWATLLDEMIKLGPSMAPKASEKAEAAASTTTTTTTPVPDPPPTKSGGTGGISELEGLFQLYAVKQNDSNSRKSIKGEFNADDWKRKCEVELKQYRESIGMEPKMDSDVLEQWWGTESRSSLYPVLWRVAQRVLTISATSAPAHRAFSTAKSLAIYNRCQKMGPEDPLVLFLYENSRRLEDENIWEAAEDALMSI